LRNYYCGNEVKMNRRNECGGLTPTSKNERISDGRYTQGLELQIKEMNKRMAKDK